MTIIPSKVWTGSTLEHLDIAARFYIAGCLPSPAVTAKPADTPPIPPMPLLKGVAAALLPHFSYESKPITPTEYKSKFSLLLPVKTANQRLAAVLSEGIYNPSLAPREILPMPGAVNIARASVSASLYDLLESMPNRYAGVITLEGVIYEAAFNAETEIEVQMITPIVIAAVQYLRIALDFNFNWAGFGSAGG